MKINDKILEDTFWGEKTKVTPEIVKFYKENPKELDLIVDKEFFYDRFIKFFFFLGIFLTVISRVLKFFFEGSWAPFVNEVILDIFSELGIAIFGGAITAYLLERLKQQQYEQNIAFRNEILEKIKQSQNAINNNDKI